MKHLSNNEAPRLPFLFSLSKRSGYTLMGILMGLSLFYLFVGCSIDDSNQDRYIIGQDPRWRELNLHGKERSLVAFNNELLAAIAKKEDFRVTLISTYHLIDELQEGKSQGILTTLKPSYLNEHLAFSDPYFLTGPVLILPITPNQFQRKKEGKKIIAMPVNSPLLRGFQDDPSTQLKFYKDILSALNDLKNGEIDGALFPAIPAYIYTETFYSRELKIATTPLTDDGIRLVTLKNEVGKKLIEKFNQGLEALKEDGSYHTALQNWGFTDVEQIKTP